MKKFSLILNKTFLLILWIVLEPENGDDVASDVSDFGGDFGDECNFPDNGGEQPLLTDDNEFNRASNDAK